MDSSVCYKYNCDYEHSTKTACMVKKLENFKANIFLCYGKTCVSDTQNLHARIVYIFNINTCTVSQEHTKNQAILSVCLWTFYVMIDYI